MFQLFASAVTEVAVNVSSNATSVLSTMLSNSTLLEDDGPSDNNSVAKTISLVCLFAFGLCCLAIYKANEGQRVYAEDQQGMVRRIV